MTMLTEYAEDSIVLVNVGVVEISNACEDVCENDTKANLQYVSAGHEITLQDRRTVFLVTRLFKVRTDPAALKLACHAQHYDRAREEGGERGFRASEQGTDLKVIQGFEWPATDAALSHMSIRSISWCSTRGSM